MGMGVGVEAGPAAGVEAVHAALEDFEHEFDICAAAVDDGEGVEAEGGAHFAVHVAGGARRADDDDGGRGREAIEKIEDAAAGFIGGRAVVEGEAEIDDGDVDGGGADDALGVAGGAGLQGGNAHGLEEGGHAVGPRIGTPAAPGEEEVQPGAFGGAGNGCDAAGARGKSRGGAERGMAGAEGHFEGRRGKRCAGRVGVGRVVGWGLGRELRGGKVSGVGVGGSGVPMWQGVGFQVSDFRFQI